MAGVGIAAAAGALAGGASLAGFGAVDVAAVLAVVLVATLYVLPTVAMRASGLVHISDQATVAEVDEVVEHGRQLLPGAARRNGGGRDRRGDRPCLARRGSGSDSGRRHRGASAGTHAGAVPLAALLAGLALALVGVAPGSAESPGWRRFPGRAEVAGAVALIRSAWR